MFHILLGKGHVQVHCPEEGAVSGPSQTRLCHSSLAAHHKLLVMSVIGDLCSRTQHLILTRCSVADICKCDEPTLHRDKMEPIMAVPEVTGRALK
jgi:hypothetical protein